MVKKESISVTIDKELAEKLEVMVNSEKFRNLSHVVEFYLKKSLKEEENEV